MLLLQQRMRQGVNRRCCHPPCRGPAPGSVHLEVGLAALAVSGRARQMLPPQLRSGVGELSPGLSRTCARLRLPLLQRLRRS